MKERVEAAPTRSRGKKRQKSDEVSTNPISTISNKAIGEIQKSPVSSVASVQDTKRQKIERSSKEVTTERLVEEIFPVFYEEAVKIYYPLRGQLVLGMRDEEAVKKLNEFNEFKSAFKRYIGDPNVQLYVRSSDLIEKEENLSNMISNITILSS